MTRTEILKAFEEKGYVPYLVTSEELDVSDLPIDYDKDYFIELCLIQKFCIEKGVWIIPDPASDEEISVFVGVLEDPEYPDRELKRIEKWYEGEMWTPVYFPNLPATLEAGIIETIKRNLI